MCPYGVPSMCDDARGLYLIFGLTVCIACSLFPDQSGLFPYQSGLLTNEPGLLTHKPRSACPSLFPALRSDPVALFAITYQRTRCQGFINISNSIV
jgi:hypothetical protein